MYQNTIISFPENVLICCEPWAAQFIMYWLNEAELYICAPAK